FEVAKLAEGTDRRADRNRVKSKEEQFSKLLGDFLDEWVAVTAPEKWQENVGRYKIDGPILTTEDFSHLVKYLVDYFRVENIYTKLRKRLFNILDLPIDDKNARVHVLREYMQLVLNDFIMNPGPSVIQPVPEANPEDGNFGLKQPFVLRWRQQLPLALASGAGVHKAIPQGNDELKLILDSRQ
ncbi:MAG: hypothetical protein KGQ60_11855, partial [Planctomycetes bacterium]|nr:hypothetical protein [Planctomycetota bacterium]